MQRRLTSRSMYVLLAMLGGYGFLTVCLILASYLTGGADLAILVSTGAGSISVPVAGLLTLFAAWVQKPDADTTSGGTGPDGSGGGTEPVLPRPLIDRSIVLIGNGYERLRMEHGPDAFRIDAGPTGGSGVRPDRPLPAAAAVPDEADATGPSGT